MKVHILTDRGFMGYVDLIFYDESFDGRMTFYRPTEDSQVWKGQQVEDGSGIPDGFKLSIDSRTMDALADQIAEQRFGTRQLDSSVLKAFEREQSRVDKLLDWMTSS
jgi:hypothetical protein